MDTFIEIFKEINISQVLVMLAGMFFFYNRLDKKFESKFDKMDSKIDRLSEKVDNIDKRLCRIEGSMATHGHCLFSQSRTDEKAS